MLYTEKLLALFYNTITKVFHALDDAQGQSQHPRKTSAFFSLLQDLNPGLHHSLPSLPHGFLTGCLSPSPASVLRLKYWDI